MELIQLNKFSELHDGKNIIFCKTDFLNDEFNHINKLENDVILITGNSDYAITDDIVKSSPKNIKKWYAQNALTNSDLVVSIPMGIENKLESLREGHGIGYYDRVQEKEIILSTLKNKEPEKFIYSNFNIHTNYGERIKYKNISIECPHIDWEESNLSLHDFFNKMLDYKMILCPVGNGVDTHRLWEVLYSNIIPITVKVNNYGIYKLYETLPIIILDKIEDLLDYDLIDKKYKEVMSNNYNLELINYNYWKDKILKNH
jgi:hypothetical protein